MIRLIDDYVVKADEYCYMLAIDTGKKNEKTGTEVLRPISYHRSLDRAIVACRQEYLRRGVKDGCIELYEAVSRIREMNDRFNELLEEAMKGAET